MIEPPWQLLGKRCSVEFTFDSEGLGVSVYSARRPDFVSKSSLSTKRVRTVSLLGMPSDADQPVRDRPMVQECRPLPDPGNAPQVTTVFAGFGDEHAVLAVRGEVDLKSAPQLGAFFDAVTASGYPSVVLDVTDMDSIDAAGLAVIVSAASSLVAQGGHLTIRSSSSEIARVLDSNWLAGLISLELTGPSRARLGSEQTAPVSATPLRAALPDVAQHLRRVKTVPANQGVVDGALRLMGTPPPSRPRIRS